MDPAFTALLGIIFGAAATALLHLTLRRKKFKEILYKEKFKAYNELTIKTMNLIEHLYLGRDKTKELHNDFLY